MKRIIEGFKVPALRPVMVTGAALVVLTTLSVLTLFFWPRSPAFLPRLDRNALAGAVVVIGPVAVFYALTGFGVMLRRQWAYYLFKTFLYIHLFLGFPVTTFFAYRGLIYMSSPHIRLMFGVRTRPNEPVGLSSIGRVAIGVGVALLSVLYILSMLFG